MKFLNEIKELKNKSKEEHIEEIRKVMSLDKNRSKTYEKLMIILAVTLAVLLFSLVGYKVYKANQPRHVSQFERTLHEVGFKSANIEAEQEELKKTQELLNK